MKPYENVLKLMKTPFRGERGNLLAEAKKIQSKSEAIVKLAKEYGTPFYALDPDALDEAAKNYRLAFEKCMPGGKHFYAVKSNYHPFLLKRFVELGFGLDVSSNRELEFALKAGAKEILFSGPGKTADDLAAALEHAEKVIVNMDSFGELERLGKRCEAKKKNIRAGVRFFSDSHGAWSKFGIPLRDLASFWKAAQKFPHLRLEGIQFHTSTNLTPEKQVEVIAELGAYLKKNFTADMRAAICFLDVGGGEYPDRMEGYYPWSHYHPWTLSAGYFLKMANAHFGKSTHFEDKYFITRASSVEQFAKAISGALAKHISPLVKCDYFTEPGRILSTRTMHLVLAVADVKGDAVIADGGINMTGWEFGQHLYFPIVNVTHPSLREIEMPIYGSLCTPRDIWGHHCYAKKMEPGDILAIPNQGAYRFTLAQNFIRPIPSVHVLERAAASTTPQFSSAHERPRRAGAVSRRSLSSSPAYQTKSPR